MRILLAVIFIFSCFLSIAQPPPPGSTIMVISEVFYDVPGTDESLEFIEITNPSDSSQRTLSLYRFTEGIEYTFPFGVIVEPLGVAVVARDSIAFENAFGFPAYQWTSGDLDDNGELIVLKNNLNIAIDSVDYQTNVFWPDASGNGKSIVLCDINDVNLGGSNWTAAETNTGVEVDGVSIFANPGTTCDDWVSVNEPKTTHFQVYPNPTDGQFMVDFAEPVSSTLSITNNLGKEVYSVELSEDKIVLVKLPNQLESGVYFLSILSKNGISSQGLMIME